MARRSERSRSNQDPSMNTKESQPTKDAKCTEKFLVNGDSLQEKVTSQRPSKKKKLGNHHASTYESNDHLPKIEGILERCQKSSIYGVAQQHAVDRSESTQFLALRTAFHLSAVPNTLLCREAEFKKVMEFCKDCISSQKAKSLYICGCPGSGKSLTLEKVRQQIADWAKEVGMEAPKVAVTNCTSLSDPRDIYHRVLDSLELRQTHATSQISHSSCLKEIKKRLCKSDTSRGNSLKRMWLLIVDEMDFLITRDQSVLYELFRLSTYEGSCCILIGIANAIDLTDRFLPNLRSLKCEPNVITFPAYGKDQIVTIVKQRLESVNINAFQSFALELCARKLAAASGDMRKALDVCRSAVEIAEKEEKETVLSNGAMGSHTKVSPDGKVIENGNMKLMSKDQADCAMVIVKIDHMAKALARTFRSPVVETIQGLPQHSQMVLCSAVRLFRKGKKDALLGELNKAYLDFCKANAIHALGPPEFSSLCRVLADQALLCLGTAKEDRLKKVSLQVNETDVVFALQEVRFFRNNLGS
ncbi:hypothetical protein O6H91_17G070500 [Diphasiastrum complanatum]|uniref:Uncharacterized protein n=1 Tax=Diphasiastrum complanatum TaxID=34168 RepID=A0ACC2B7V1_DIPCM|nr:hypothetical protein O6H91_17G070500 [Diphasiastrum complanatum]